MFSRWLRNLLKSQTTSAAKRQRTRQLLVEGLEDRRVLATFSIADVQVNETASMAAITISASSVSGTVTVDWATSNGTATAGDDYTTSSGTATLYSWQTQVVVNVPLSNDEDKESNETFYVMLSNPSGGSTISDDSATVIIIDNDALGVVRALDRFTGGGVVEHSGAATFNYATESGVGLNYSSVTYGTSILDIRTVQPDDGAVPSLIQAELLVNNSSVRTIYYDTTGLSAGDPQRFVFDYDGSSLGSGTYEWTLKITETVGSDESFRTLSGQVDVYDRLSSPIGEGWEISELDRLVVSTDWVTVLFGNGSVTHYYRDDIQAGGGGGGPGGGPGGGGGSGGEGLIENNNGTFTYTTREKGKLEFDSSGKLLLRADVNNNKTEYTYTSGLLTKITRQDGREIDLVYSSGKLMSITDWAGRVTTISQTSDRLTLITATDPDDGGDLDAAETAFTYWTSSGLLKTVEDALSNTTTINYSVNDRVSSIVYPGSATYSYEPQLVQGIIPTGDGTIGSPAELPESDPFGSVTDPLSITTYSKYSPLGHVIEFVDGLDNTTLWERNEAGFVTKLTQADPDGPGGPLESPVTEYEYDENNNLLEVTRPDETTLQWVYNTTWNKPTQFTDAQGSVTKYTLNGAGNITQIKQIVGQEDDWETVNPDDIVTSLTYTANPTAVGQVPGGLVLSITDPRGFDTEFEYGTNDALPSFGQLISVTYAAGTAVEATVEYTYNANRLLESILDELENETSFTYDDLGRLILTTYPDPDGGGGPQTAPTEATGYNALNQVISRTDGLGKVTGYAYDSANRLWKVTLPDPDGGGGQTASVTEYDYDLAGRLTTVTDALNKTTVYDYDDAHRMISIVYPDPDGGGALESPEVGYEYDNLGRLIAYTDPLSRVTQYEYDVLSQLVTLTLPDPDGGSNYPVWSYTYTDNGWTESITDPLSNVTAFEYDDAGRLIKQILEDPDGGGGPLDAPEIEYEYDRASNLISVTSAIGAVTSYVYDARNRRTQATLPDPDGVGVMSSPIYEWEYDDASRLVSFIDDLNNETTYEYDHLGRLIVRTLPDPDGGGGVSAPEESYEYDAVGHVVAYTDSLTNVTDYTYDYMGRLIKIEQPDPDGGGPLGRPTTEIAYDKLSRHTELTDPNENVTQWEYDNLGRLIAETDPLNETATYSYDAASRLVSTTDRRGKVTQYEYDDLDRLTAEIWKNGGSTVRTLSYSYDAIGNLTEASDPAATYHFDYDNLYRVIQTTGDYGGSVKDFRLTNEYDDAGRRTSLGLEIKVSSTWTDDLLNQYVYDDLDRLKVLTQEGQSGGATVQEKRVDFLYETGSLFWQITRYDSLSGGGANEVATTVYTRDDLGRITTLEHTHDTTTIAEYNFSYDAYSRITQIDADALVGLSGTTDFTYDTTGQLLEADHSHISDEEYEYDESGNRTLSGYTTDAGNRLTSDGVFNYTYDDNGNRLTKTRISSASADDKTVEYTWDHRNRLITITNKNNAGKTTQSVSYAYDVFDRRVAKTVTTYVYNPPPMPSQISFETTRYIYDGDDVLAQTEDNGDVTHRHFHGPAVDQIFAIEKASNGEVLWALTDHLGSVRDIVDDDGDVVNHIVYDSYGNVASETDAAIAFLYGFTGRERDEETGLNYHRARYLDTGTGRWLSEDLIGFAAGDPNINRYVGNDPVNSRDPSGLDEDLGLVLTRYSTVDSGAMWAKASNSPWSEFFSTLGSRIEKTARDLRRGLIEEPVGRVYDFIGMSAEALSTAVFGTDWEYDPLSDAGKSVELGKTTSQLAHDTVVGIGSGVRDLGGVYPSIQYALGEISEDDWSDRQVNGSVNLLIGARASLRPTRGSPPPSTPPIIVTDNLIRRAMKDSQLSSQQSGGVSLPVIQRYVRRLEAGESPPPIKVDGNIIVDGNHRYIAGRIFGQEPTIQPWKGGKPDRVIPWDDLPISPKDWGNQ